ncbi:MAG: ATP-dependent DNA helicase [Erysipelotrichales bacterium]|nr:ATP-dependent DNA helicase [Erysipelotrichales bacterium]
MNKIKIGVGDLVNLIYRSGNLVDNTYSPILKQEGLIIHQFFQGKYGADSLKEYYISTNYQIESFDFEISGRIDGLINENNNLIIDEIKSTRQNVDELDDIIKIGHLAQAKLYGYMYLLKENIPNIMLRITYIEVETRKIRHFYYEETFEDLKKFFETSIEKFLEFYRIFARYQLEKLTSVKDFAFPYLEYRQGQRELMTYVYDAILQGEMLYANAPTGIGKTSGTLFPAIKTIKTENDKIFYLTAKSSLKETALKTLRRFYENGLNLKSIFITSKDKICFQEEKDCEKCPFSLGYFDRIYYALIDIYSEVTIFEPEVIIDYAQKHQVCPFEYTLDISNHVDVIIGDYNYAFCPRTHLARYFEESNYRPVLLVDEAHNLVSRSKDMYSASFLLTDVKNFRIKVKRKERELRKNLKKLTDYLTNEFQSLDKVISFEDLDFGLMIQIKQVLENAERILFKNKPDDSTKQILESYFLFYNFYRISEFYSERFIYLVEKTETGDLLFSIVCLDSSGFIRQTVENFCQSAIFFSATLAPLDYYQNVISEKVGESIVIESPFPPENFEIINYRNLSTRYRDRKKNMAELIEIIKTAISVKPGNYIAFFPSYEYLNQAAALFNSDNYDLIIQTNKMTSFEFNETLERFKNLEKPKIGFFVMGGLFSEGVDYSGDTLSGVIIVGVGMPQISYRNDLIKTYFDESKKDGFDYAYLYPGINKVVQAAGRVIRSETDYGFALLIDDRFAEKKYYDCYPKNWRKLKIINRNSELKLVLEEFFAKF